MTQITLQIKPLEACVKPDHDLAGVKRLLSLESLVMGWDGSEEERRQRLSTFVLLRHLYKIPGPEGGYGPMGQELQEKLKNASVMQRVGSRYVCRCDRCGGLTQEQGEYDVYNEAVDNDMSHGYFHHSCYDTYSFSYCTTCGKNDYFHDVDEKNLPPIMAGSASVEAFLSVSTSDPVYTLGKEIAKGMMRGGDDRRIFDVVYLADGHYECSQCGCPDLLSGLLVKNHEQRISVCLRHGHIDTDELPNPPYRYRDDSGAWFYSWERIYGE